MHHNNANCPLYLQYGNRIPNPPRSLGWSTALPNWSLRAGKEVSMYPTSAIAETKEASSVSARRSASRAHQLGGHRKRRSASFHMTQHSHPIVAVQQPEARI